MTDPATITPEKRAEIKAKLDEFDARVGEIEAEARPTRDALRVFEERIWAVDAERDTYLDDLPEVAGKCETCGKLLFNGDRGSRPFSDETGMVFCEADSMSFADLKHHREIEDPPHPDEDPDTTEGRTWNLELIAEHLKAGGSLDDKVTEVLS